MLGYETIADNIALQAMRGHLRPIQAPDYNAILWSGESDPRWELIIALHSGLYGGHAADASLSQGASHQLRQFEIFCWSRYTCYAVNLIDFRETLAP